jgi:hypothetical protein
MQRRGPPLVVHLLLELLKRYAMHETQPSFVDPKLKPSTSTLDIEADRRARKRVALPGRMLVAAGLCGLVGPVIVLVLTSASMMMVHPRSAALAMILPFALAILVIGCNTLALYGGVLLLERRRREIVFAGLAALALGLVLGLPLALTFPLYLLSLGLTALFGVTAAFFTFRAVADADVQTAMRHRSSRRSGGAKEKR